MTCPDLCTAEKCRELETRITLLESELIELNKFAREFLFQGLIDVSDKLDEHTNSDIVFVHNFAFDISIQNEFNKETLEFTNRIRLQNNDNYVAESLDITSLSLFPAIDGETEESTFKFEIIPQENRDNLFRLTLGSNILEDTLIAENPKLEVTPINSRNTLEQIISLQIGDYKTEDTLEIKLDSRTFEEEDFDRNITDKIEEILKEKELSLLISPLGNNDYQFSVNLGQQQASDILDLPRDRTGGGGGGSDGGEDGEEEEPPLPQTTVSLFGEYKEELEVLELRVTVNGKSASEVIDLSELDVSIPDDLIEKIDAIHTVTTAPIAGQLKSGECRKPAEDDEDQSTYTQTDPVSYNDVGFNLIKTVGEHLDNKLDSFYSSFCAYIASPQETTAIAALPEFWQIRVGSDRPQLVVIFRAKDRKKLQGQFPLYIPHYNGGNQPSITGYKKGNKWVKAILPDNSHIIINGNTHPEAQRMIDQFLALTPYATDQKVSITQGENRRRTFKEAEMLPYRADFFSKGQTNAYPDWQYYFD